jgi:NTE family protein
MKRALVLGGGGNVGIAWELGVLAGLADGGVDARGADVVVGTSAGAVVGTSIAHGTDPRELLERRRSEPPRSLGDHMDPNGRDPKAFQESLTAIFTLWTSVPEMTQEHLARIGALAVAAPTMPEEQWVDWFAENGWAGWPGRALLVAAVDCESGAFRAFDAASGVPVERAVGASCAVPGLFPPVSIDGARYMDGGVRSGTSADLAQRIEPDAVLVVAPIGWTGTGIHVLAAKQLAQEMGALESAGARVRLIEPDDAARGHMKNLMDPAEAPAAADAGRAHGARIAASVGETWG